jgi:hypothetical protein
MRRNYLELCCANRDLLKFIVDQGQSQLRWRLFVEAQG